MVEEEEAEGEVHATLKSKAGVKIIECSVQSSKEGQKSRPALSDSSALVTNSKRSALSRNYLICLTMRQIGSTQI